MTFSEAEIVFQDYVPVKIAVSSCFMSKTEIFLLTCGQHVNILSVK
jgi:hypothetical protein